MNATFKSSTGRFDYAVSKNPNIKIIKKAMNQKKFDLYQRTHGVGRAICWLCGEKFHERSLLGLGCVTTHPFFVHILSTICVFRVSLGTLN